MIEYWEGDDYPDFVAKGTGDQVAINSAICAVKKADYDGVDCVGGDDTATGTVRRCGEDFHGVWYAYLTCRRGRCLCVQLSFALRVCGPIVRKCEALQTNITLHFRSCFTTKGSVCDILNFISSLKRKGSVWTECLHKFIVCIE